MISVLRESQAVRDEGILIGQKIRDYEIQEEIGSGGYGAVYRAHQAEVKRDVAIKVILPEHANKADFVQRFQIEAQLVAQLEHPHIIPLYDYWQDDNGAFLVMRYIAEGTLEELLVKEESLSWVEARRIFLQIVEALEVAHDNGVIHRDIKPANILLDERGNAYLTDFGLAWMLGNTSQEHMVAGTMGYIAPELLQKGMPSPQSDLYALGILLYQMLTGTLPFVGTMTEMIDGHLNVPMPPILESRPDLPDIVEDMIFRLTLKDPQDRYQTVKLLLDTLKDVPVSHLTAPKATVSMASMAPRLQQLTRKRGNTLSLRNRFSMLNTIYTYWIEGVLENLLSGYALLDLDLHLERRFVNASGDNLDDFEDVQAQAIAESAESILHIFEAYNGKLLILGEAGVGKSTLLLALARDLLQQASEDEDFPIPVIFNLSSWDGKLPLADWIEQELNEKYQVPHSVAKRWVQEDALLLLLDGLDEVREEHRQNCLDAINTWRDEHAFVDVVVSSRMIDYEALSTQVQLNGCAIIQPLADEQVITYLDTIGSQTSGLRTVLNQNPEMRELSHSPLMLGVMVTAYQDVTVEELPEFASTEEQRNYFFNLYVERAWKRRIADKNFALEDISNGFSRLAFGMRQHSQAMFFVEDLQPDWLTTESQFHRIYCIVMLLILSVVWLFSSLLFLAPDEYVYYAAFGAVWGWLLFFVSERIGIIRSLIVFVVLISIFRITLDWNQSITGYFQKSLFRSTLPYTLILGILMTLYHRTGQTSRAIHSVDSLNFSLASTRWIAGIAGIVGGLFVTLPDIVLGGDIVAVEILFKILGTGFLAWFMTGFRANQVQQSAQINEKIHRSFRNGLRMGLISGLVAMFLVAIAFYPEGFDLAEGAPALFNFLPLAVTAFFIYGGAVVVQHYLLRRGLVRQNAIPSQFIALLQEGVQLGIMRRVGGGFIFIHRYLLEYFAGLDD